MMKARLTSFLLAACWVGLTAVSCRSSPTPAPATTPNPPPEVLRIGVATSATAIVELIRSGYQSDHATLQFVPGNNETLFADLEAGALDAILVHHIPPGNERWFNPVAVDGLAIIVHPDNPVADLSLGEVQAIFNGRVTNWSSLGGRDQAIALISREPGAETRVLLRQRVMAEQRIDINALLQPGDGALLETVAGDPTAIGYTMMGNAAQTNVKTVGLNGRLPTPNTTGAQTYPLTAPLYFVHGDENEPQGILRALLAWMQSADGQQTLNQRYGRVR